MRNFYLIIILTIISISIFSCTPPEISENTEISVKVTEGEDGSIDEENDD